MRKYIESIYRYSKRGLSQEQIAQIDSVLWELKTPYETGYSFKFRECKKFLAEQPLMEERKYNQLEGIINSFPNLTITIS